ncbi:MAG: hypothetical protein E6I91_03560 [Chloroflexi bacterium]|nr:MAG: hypothetical protein E6I91_03560 [Chloroflexota bacterium]
MSSSIGIQVRRILTQVPTKMPGKGFVETGPKTQKRSHKICQALRKEGEKALGSRETDGPFALQSNVLKRSVDESPGAGAGQASWPAN